MIQGEERRRGSEEAVAALEDRLSRLDTEQESILSSVAEEIDAACRALFKDSQDKLKVNTHHQLFPIGTHSYTPVPIPYSHPYTPKRVPYTHTIAYSSFVIPNTHIDILLYPIHALLHTLAYSSHTL